MRRRGRGVCAAVVLTAAVACAAPASETESLPLQESAIAVDDEVRGNATVVAEYAVTEEELGEIRAACADAEAVPLEDGEACLRIMEFRFDGCTPPFDYCVRVYDAARLEMSYAGWAEVVEGEGNGSLCEDGPDSVCLRVGLTPEALQVVEPGPTDPTTSSPSPTETSPETGTPTPTPTETTSPESPGEPSDAATG